MTTYAIPTDRLAKLDSTIAALNKRADRLGVSPLTYARTGAEWCEFRPASKPRRERRWEVAEVELDGGRVGLAGWHLLGTVEHLTGENLLRAVPGEVIPETYRAVAQSCDHCGLDRQRADTFVVGHEDGRTMQLGRSCIADYLGHADPSRLASWLEAVRELVSAEGDPDDENDRGPRERVTFRPDDIVAVALGATRSFGWLSKAEADRRIAAGERGVATASRVVAWLGGRKPYRDLVEAGMTVTADDFEQAAAAIDWAREQQGGDYIGNLRALARQERVDGKAVGLLASLPAAHARALESAAEAAARAQRIADAKAAREALVTEPAPTGKVTVNGSILGFKEVTSSYGYSDVAVTKATILTPAGWRLYVTLPAAITDAAVGDTVEMVVTVKPSDDDASFAFGSRPTRARIIAKGE